ncbi:nucleotidyltransferase [hot springs metagenome]|uniref:Nucleotidyltransferase n=1 Tax=hot springs metagenome TaxID=433727 RepID=A0A5J4LAK9_9ZZZZ
MDKNPIINLTASIKEALKKLDETAEKVLFVVDENNILLGTITDGDIRRYILKTGTIEGTIESIYHRKPIYATENLSKEEIKKLIFENRVELLPILDREKKVVGYYRWTDFYDSNKKEILEKKLKDIPVVIMAGGKGTRLDPFTRVLPKPLLPVKDKTITEMIIDSFKKFGVKKFYLTLNYKGKVIESYFNSIEKDYEIEFIWEEEFLGTAGSLHLLKDFIDTDLFVSNCDIMLNTNYNDVYEYHKKMNASFTTITSIQHYKVPYGVVYTRQGGFIEKIEEKPEHTFQINTGVYLLNKEALDYITLNKYIDMPQLIQKLLNKNKKVIAYPANKKDYLDVGQWEEYRSVLKLLEE